MKIRTVCASLIALSQLAVGAWAAEVPFSEFKRQYDQCLAGKASAHSGVRRSSVLGVSFIAPRGYEVTVDNGKSLVLSPYQDLCVQALRARGLPHPMRYRNTRGPIGPLKFDSDPGQFAIFADWTNFHLGGSPQREANLLGEKTVIYQERGGMYAMIRNPRQDGRLLAITSLVGEAESLAFLSSLGPD